MRGILWAVLQEPIAVPPIYDQGSPHHITLFYDVEKKKYAHLIGEEFNTFSTAVCYNDDIQALACDIPSRIPHKPNPHITISYREGVEPSASNAMLVSGDRSISRVAIPLKLKIEFFEFPICDHHWLKNGTRKGVQLWICKYCGKSKTEGDRPKGRPFKAK